MPGCLNYIVATDLSDANSIGVTEVWQSNEAHAASPALLPVKTAMSEGRPLIAKFSRVAEITPVGGSASLHLRDGVRSTETTAPSRA
jgi:quinol monooxygenase YgiN